MKRLTRIDTHLIPVSELPRLRRLICRQFMPIGFNPTAKSRAVWRYRLRMRRLMYQDRPAPRLER